MNMCETHTKSLSETLKGRGYLGDPGVNGMMISKLSFNKYDIKDVD
jgi:hypothetical protein